MSKHYRTRSGKMKKKPRRFGPCICCQAGCPECDNITIQDRMAAAKKCGALFDRMENTEAVRSKKRGKQSRGREDAPTPSGVGDEQSVGRSD